jgi:hypothetical protein
MAVYDAAAIVIALLMFIAAMTAVGKVGVGVAKSAMEARAWPHTKGD